ncbi:MAG: hypothetical protein ACRDF4_06595 [Rhabdochlamydiaceae bacterium]
MRKKLQRRLSEHPKRLTISNILFRVILVPDAVTRFKDHILDVANFVYAHPELSGEEFQSVERIVKVLQENGLDVKKVPLLGMKTAFATSLVQEGM